MTAPNYLRSNKSPDKTRYTVKILSGHNKGATALFDSLESAQIEACYMADVHDLCTVIRGPICHD